MYKEETNNCVGNKKVYSHNTITQNCFIVVGKALLIKLCNKKLTLLFQSVNLNNNYNNTNKK